MTGLEKFYITSAYLHSQCYSGERPVGLLLKLCTCFLPGLQKCTWIGYDFIFITFSTFNVVIFLTSDFYPHCELGHFSPSIYKQWVPREHNSSYNFIPIFLKLRTCFLHSLKMCICYSYNPCLNFCHFSNLAFVFVWLPWQH